MNSDSSTSRDTMMPTPPEEEHQSIDDFISAVMDGSHAENNDGTIKTYNKLKLTKEAKTEHKCIELL